jgi:hypothetical protein
MTWRKWVKEEQIPEQKAGAWNLTRRGVNASSEISLAPTASLRHQQLQTRPPIPRPPPGG